MDVGQAIFRRFGLWAVAAAVVGATVVWVLAHNAAAPGSPVSVLWGLVEYTKKEPSISSRRQAPMITEGQSLETSPVPESIGSEPPASQLGEGLDIVGHRYGEATYAQRQQALRDQRGLRELSELESGQRLDSLPSGTFGFVDAVDVMVRGRPIQAALSSAPARRFSTADRLGTFPFEVHVFDRENRVLLGFTAEATASAAASGTVKTIALSARPRGDLTTLLAISVSKVKAMSYRAVETGPADTYSVIDLDL